MRSIPPSVDSILSQKKIAKNMRIARQIAEDNNPCYSRHVGCVIVDEDNVVLGTAYNGPPRDTPHCDSTEYIRDILWQKLTNKEKVKLAKQFYSAGFEEKDIEKYPWYEEIVQGSMDGCKICPRRLLDYSAGVRPDICSCQHAERNAISNSNGSVKGGILFGWCITSCWDCAGAIINARIKEVHFLEGEEYSKGVWALYQKAKIPVFLYTKEELE